MPRTLLAPVVWLVLVGAPMVGPAVKTVNGASSYHGGGSCLGDTSGGTSSQWFLPWTLHIPHLGGDEVVQQ